MMRAEFYDYLDFLFCTQAPAIPDAGEDSFLCLKRENSALTAVFDGCGGLGSRRYPGYQDHTGAWVASRLACGAIHDWYEENKEIPWQNSGEMLGSMKTALQQVLGMGSVYGKSNLMLGGSMVRDFPTTIALALARLEEDKVVVHVVWAGDSRVYLLNQRGLAQLTVDDSEITDAFENLTNDGELTNLLSSDGNYTLHYKRLVLSREEPTLIFASTDGCFGYIPSPMEFEYTLCRSILDTETVNGLSDKLREEFKKTAGDDFALCCMGLFCGSYQGVRKLAAARAEALERSYISTLMADRSRGQELWEEYRRIYERYL